MMWTFLCLEQVERRRRRDTHDGGWPDVSEHRARDVLLLSRKIIYVFGDKTLIFLFDIRLFSLWSSAEDSRDAISRRFFFYLFISNSLAQVDVSDFMLTSSRDDIGESSVVVSSSDVHKQRKAMKGQQQRTSEQQKEMIWKHKSA